MSSVNIHLRDLIVSPLWDYHCITSSRKWEEVPEYSLRQKPKKKSIYKRTFFVYNILRCFLIEGAPSVRCADRRPVRGRVKRPPCLKGGGRAERGRGDTCFRTSPRRNRSMAGRTPQSSAFRETAADSVHLAVPEKCVGLPLILAFFDRCGNSGLPVSAAGGGSPQFPLHRGAYKERKPPQSAALRETATDSSPGGGACKE